MYRHKRAIDTCCKSVKVGVDAIVCRPNQASRLDSESGRDPWHLIQPAFTEHRLNGRTIRQLILLVMI